MSYYRSVCQVFENLLRSAVLLAVGLVAVLVVLVWFVWSQS